MSTENIIFLVTLFGSLGWIIYKTGQNSESLSRIQDGVGKLFRRTDQVIAYLGIRDGKQAVQFFSNSSPVRLTEKGKNILEKSGGKNYVDANLDSLIKILDSLDLKSFLDVQSRASSMMSDEWDSDKFKEIRDFIFENPVYEKVNLNMIVMSQIFGIYLMDKYIETHPKLDNDTNQELVEA